MASEAEWLVQVWDKPGVLQSRFQHAGAHMAYHQPSRESGRLVFSGPTLERHPTAGSPMEVTGSVLVFRLAGGEQEVWEIVNNDPMAKAGIWDLQRLTVTPFKLFRPQ